MNTALQFTSILELPQLLVVQLLSNPIAAFNEGLIQNNAISSNKIDQIVKIEGALVFRTLQLEDLQKTIAEKLEVNNETARAITQSIINEFCGPIRWYFPNLNERVLKMGFTLKKDDFFPVEQPTTTVAAALNAITLSTVGDMPASIKNRTVELVKKVLESQQYDPVELKKQMTLSVTDRGLGMSINKAQAVLNKLREYLAVFKFSDAEDKHEMISTPKQIVDPSTLVNNLLEPHEAADIIATQKAAASVSKSSLSTQQESLVAAVLDAESLHDRAPELQQRWKMIVEARIGGARDAAKTQSLLAASADGGGLGLQPDEAQRLATLLEQSASGFEKRREEFSVMEKIASVQRSTAGIVAGPEAVQRETQKELNQRFVSMFGKDAVEEIRRETHREIESPEMAHPGEGARTHIAPVQFTQPQQPSPAIAVPLPPPPSSATPSQEPRYVPKVPDKLRQLIDAEAPILPTKPKVPGVPVVKKASDIKQGPRLVGPIDELRIMTMIDFRRLSPDVSVRIQKIRSKIDVIGQDGPHEKIRAVQAVEQSEPMRLYRDLLKRSLISQRSIQELSAEQKNLKQPYLESEEIAALAQFLTQIRYSSL